MEIDLERIARSPFVIGAVGALITAVKFTPGASCGLRSDVFGGLSPRRKL